MFCQECGKENDTGSKFCAGCGAALVSPTQQSKSDSQPQSYPSSHAAQPVQQPAQPRRHWLVTLGIVVWIILTVYIGFVMFTDFLTGALIGAFLAFFCFSLWWSSSYRPFTKQEKRWKIRTRRMRICSDK